MLCVVDSGVYVEGSVCLLFAFISAASFGDVTSVGGRVALFEGICFITVARLINGGDFPSVSGVGLANERYVRWVEVLRGRFVEFLRTTCTKTFFLRVRDRATIVRNVRVNRR